jgi:hypothetical protein
VFLHDRVTVALVTPAGAVPEMLIETGMFLLAICALAGCTKCVAARPVVMMPMMALVIRLDFDFRGCMFAPSAVNRNSGVCVRFLEGINCPLLSWAHAPEIREDALVLRETQLIWLGDVAELNVGQESDGRAYRR